MHRRTCVQVGNGCWFEAGDHSIDLFCGDNETQVTNYQELDQADIESMVLWLLAWAWAPTTNEEFKAGVGRLSS